MLLACAAARKETTPAMVAAAGEEGQVVWYLGGREGRRGGRQGLQEQYPKIDVEASGLGALQHQPEYGSGIHVDVVARRTPRHSLEAAEVVAAHASG